MIASVEHNGLQFQVNLEQPIDISIGMEPNPELAKAWYLETLKIDPVKGDGFVGSVAAGGSVNFRTIVFNPHGHGTHTECLGHITEEVFSVNQHIKQFFFIAELISIEPEIIEEDHIITLQQLKEQLGEKTPEAVIIRTLPNSDSKLTKQYSNTNPPFIDKQVAKELRERGVKHLLIDTPSVDKEIDGGLLLAHHEFWNIPKAPRFDCSITELIFVPNSVQDGQYLLNLGFASFENDASPSKPVLYKIS